MQVFDIVILILLGLCLLKGVVRGVLHELFALASLLTGAILSWHFGPWLARETVRVLHTSPGFAAKSAAVLLFLLGFLLIVVVAMFLGHKGKLPQESGGTRVGGGLLGLVNGVLVLAVVLYGLLLHPFPQALGPVLKRSQLTPPFVDLGAATLRGGARLFGPS
jgi:membrane protein required for colicin V production